MTALRARDIAALGDAIADLAAARSLSELRSAIPSRVAAVVACDSASYNEVGAPARPGTPTEVFVASEPYAPAHAPARFERFTQLIHQNPLLAHVRATGTTDTLRMSDHISRRAFHALEIYDEVYRDLGAEYQLACSSPAGAGVVAITVTRTRRDFDVADMALLDALRPFLLATLRNLRGRELIDATLTALQSADGPVSAVLACSWAGLEAADERSERWLADLRRQAPLAADTLACWAARPRPPQLTLDTPDGAQLARHVSGAGHTAAVLVQPVARPPSPAALGLTERQAQVLARVAAGDSNEEVARALQISAHTVAHHLEQIYRRLGVSSRTAAIRRLNDHRR